MSSTAKSRWATDDPEEAEAESQRKREKEAKKRAKSERQQQLEEAEKAQQHAEISTRPHGQSNGMNGDEERSSKRRRVSVVPAASEDNEAEKETQLLRFPITHWGPCGDVEAYDKLNDIEEGSYGWVSRAKNISTGEVVALKKLKMDNCNDGFPVTGLREIQTLMTSRHPNIVHLREIVCGSAPTE